jgi:hypothetical protein
MRAESLKSRPFLRMCMTVIYNKLNQNYGLLKFFLQGSWELRRGSLKCIITPCVRCQFKRSRFFCGGIWERRERTLLNHYTKQDCIQTIIKFGDHRLNSIFFFIFRKSSITEINQRGNWSKLLYQLLMIK